MKSNVPSHLESKELLGEAIVGEGLPPRGSVELRQGLEPETHKAGDRRADQPAVRVGDNSWTRKGAGSRVRSQKSVRSEHDRGEDQGPTDGLA